MSRYRPKPQITHLVIHCAATPNGKPVATGTIDQLHRKRDFKRAYTARLGEGDWAGRGLHAPGLAAIGYHFVIDTNGTVHCGRRLTETGAHTVDKRHPRGHPKRRYYNEHAIATCIVGTDKFTPKQWDALKTHIRCFQRDFHPNNGHKPGLKVIGHHDIDSGKECPCFDVQAWVNGGMQPLPQNTLITE